MPSENILKRSTKELENALAAGQNRPDRLPGLVAIFNRLPKLFAEDIVSLSYLQPKVTLAEISAGRFSQFMPLPGSSVTALVRAEKLKGSICFAADAAATFAFVEAALGYDPIQPSLTPSRSPSATECSVLRVLFRRLARSLTNAFSLVVDVTFEVDVVAEVVEFVSVSRPVTPTVAVKLMVEYAGRAGYLTIAIPQVLLAPIRANLEVPPPAEASSSAVEVDLDWTRKLNDELARAFVSATAVLGETMVSLHDVSCFKVGSTIEIPGVSFSKIKFEVNENGLFWCELGRRDNGLLMRITGDYGTDDEAVEEVWD